MMKIDDLETVMREDEDVSRECLLEIGLESSAT